MLDWSGVGRIHIACPKLGLEMRCFQRQSSFAGSMQADRGIRTQTSTSPLAAFRDARISKHGQAKCEPMTKRIVRAGGKLGRMSIRPYETDEPKGTARPWP